MKRILFASLLVLVLVSCRIYPVPQSNTQVYINEQIKNLTPIQKQCSTADDCGPKIECPDGKTFAGFACNDGKCSQINYFRNPCYKSSVPLDSEPPANCRTSADCAKSITCANNKTYYPILCDGGICVRKTDVADPCA